MQRFLLSISALFFSVTLRAETSVLYHWVQLVGDQQFELRAVVPKHQACPLVEQEDGQTASMLVRARPNTYFPVTVCYYPYTNQQHPKLQASVQHALRADRIAFIGHTGCIADAAESCQQQAAQRDLIILNVARQHPDMLVHTGHMAQATLSGYRTHDRWSSWRRDWFVPASVFAEDTVFVFVRSPAESCHGAWRGWVRFFAVGPWSPSCVHSQDTWFAHWGHFYAVIVDGSLNQKKAIDHSASIITHWHLDTLYHRPWLITYPALWDVNTQPIQKKISLLYRHALAPWLVRNSSLVFGSSAEVATMINVEGLPIQITMGNHMNTHRLPEHIVSHWDHDRLSHAYLDQHASYSLMEHGDEESMNRLWHMSWHVVQQDMSTDQQVDRILASVEFRARQFRVYGSLEDYARSEFSQEST